MSDVALGEGGVALDGAALRAGTGAGVRAGAGEAAAFDIAATRRSLFAALLDARDRFGASKVILEDPDRNPLAYKRLVLGAMVLGRKFSAFTAPGENVGILLPNVQGVAATFFALTAFGRVPAMLNFSAGLRNIRSACDTAGIKTIITARRFIEQAKLDDVVAALGETRRIVYLEDVRASVGILDKVRGLADSLRARAIDKASGRGPDDAAVILFTSGSEGHPKGVVLSHANLVANAMQISLHAGAHFTPDDVIFDPLPVFHSFGLTAGLLMGLLNGMKVILYPSPLHYRQIPKLIGETKATILFSTDTFLQGYAKAAGEGDLDSVRFVVAGAERVKDDTRRLWSRYGAGIMEGYGATECAPVISCVQPGNDATGTVGTFLPGISYRLEPVEGIHEGGRLSVTGPNVMLGYLFADKPGELVPPVDGWHDTGDIVTVEDGVIAIKGRAKRFAKIGGEMVSLAAVETMIGALWADSNHVVVSLPDPRKGEQLVLVTDKPDADRDALMVFARKEGFPELWMPRAILVVASIPVMGSGKIDVMAAVELARINRPLL
jgi:acyl-[acyl-carrier-protein]-phospholipid O-acyltransferase / long-chain-fatty-acid--[acyl-carrier-protein] ligase